MTNELNNIIADAVRKIEETGADISEGIIILPKSGTINVVNVSEAISKQIPKKPVFSNGYFCPVCGGYIEKGHRCHHNDCGQAIDWSEV